MNFDGMRELSNDPKTMWGLSVIMKGLGFGLLVAAYILQHDLKQPIPDIVIENHLYFKEESNDDRKSPEGTSV